MYDGWAGFMRDLGAETGENPWTSIRHREGEVDVDKTFEM